MKHIAKTVAITLSSIFYAQASVAEQCTQNAPIIEAGEASYYADMFQGRTTRYGETFNQNALTAASLTFPHNAILLVTNTRNNESVIVRVNDTGAFDKYGRIIDLSKSAAKKIGMINSGTAKVTIRLCNKLS